MQAWNKVQGFGGIGVPCASFPFLVTCKCLIDIGWTAFCLLLFPRESGVNPALLRAACQRRVASTFNTAPYNTIIATSRKFHTHARPSLPDTAVCWQSIQFRADLARLPFQTRTCKRKKKQEKGFPSIRSTEPETSY
jgi:hypothetical protein